MKEKESESIGDIVKRVVQDVSEKKLPFEAQLLENWRQIVGEKIFQHTQLIKYTNQTLFILVDHSTWMLEMKSRYNQQIINTINQRFNEEKVKKIVLTIGVIER